MTREEAIELLEKEKAYMLGHGGDTQANALDIAIKALEQEPCEDAIDRAEAMTEIMMFAGNVKSDEEDIYIKVSDVVQLLRELPSVTPTQKWIPVSERLPEKNGKYLAYIINKKDTNLQYIMTCEYYEGDLWNWFPDDDCASDNVVAWMPLPEPYKTESEG